jgi:predicted aldo/keto reductase-like oxidoreductase
VGGAALAGGILACSSSKEEPSTETAAAAGGETAEAAADSAVVQAPDISRRRTLGRTGFQVSDISIGCGYISEAAVIRFAYDHGINYFDTAETYSNGDSERKIGEAMEHLDRDKIFITTKLVLDPEADAASVKERFGQCLERMKTDYADALYIHDVRNMDLITHAGFHTATADLKAEGRLKHVGISSHGPRTEEDASMGNVLQAAVEDGRFDLMLLSYNYLNREEAERVLAACKAKQVGTTAMKTMPCYLEVEPWDPENPYEGYTNYIERVGEQGVSREEAIERIENWIAEQESLQTIVKPFVEKHGIATQEQFRQACIQWVLNNPDMHTICVSMPDFDSVSAMLPLSGTQLSDAGAKLLRDYGAAFGHQYCRVGCATCLPSCPEKVPVSTVMRYRTYFRDQGREKHAMRKYAALGKRNAAACLACNAPCVGSCPHGVNIQGQMIRAHGTLSLA